MISKIMFQVDDQNSFWKKYGKYEKKHRDIKLATTKARRNYLVSKSNYDTIIFFSKIVSHRSKKKPKVLNYNLHYFGLSISEVSKIVK